VQDRKPTALVTGASSGIGAATVRALAAAGWETVAAARRLERCETLAAEVGGRALALDVTDAGSVAALGEALPKLDAVVHSAGGALGLERVEEADEALLPALRHSPAPIIVVVGSVAGTEVYEGGGGYTAAKHAAHAVAETLRLELHAEGVRVSEIAPGLVETEFSLVRFAGDAERAASVYRGINPLTPEDVADAIAYCVTRPANVDIDYLTIKPVAQASATIVHRRG